MAAQVDREHVRFANYDTNWTVGEWGDMELAWRISKDRVKRLIIAGRRARSALNRANEPQAIREAADQLRQVNDALASADDWARRLRTALQVLEPISRAALHKLVRLGCVPDALLICVDAQRGWGPSGGTRKDTLAYRGKLIELAASFEQLAKECDRYLKVRASFPAATYRLDPNIPVWLRRQVISFQLFIADSDPRLTVRGARAESHLISAMMDVKTVTGTFQDMLMADLLKGTRDEEFSADSLRRTRAREPDPIWWTD